MLNIDVLATSCSNIMLFNNVVNIYHDNSSSWSQRHLSTPREGGGGGHDHNDQKGGGAGRHWVGSRVTSPVDKKSLRTESQMVIAEPMGRLLWLFRSRAGCRLNEVVQESLFRSSSTSMGAGGSDVRVGGRQS